MPRCIMHVRLRLRAFTAPRSGRNARISYASICAPLSNYKASTCAHVSSVNLPALTQYARRSIRSARMNGRHALCFRDKGPITCGRLIAIKKKKEERKLEMLPSIVPNDTDANDMNANIRHTFVRTLLRTHRGNASRKCTRRRDRNNVCKVDGIVSSMALNPVIGVCCSSSKVDTTRQGG